MSCLNDMIAQLDTMSELCVNAKALRDELDGILDSWGEIRVSPHWYSLNSFFIDPVQFGVYSIDWPRLPKTSDDPANEFRFAHVVWALKNWTAIRSKCIMEAHRRREKAEMVMRRLNAKSSIL